MEKCFGHGIVIEMELCVNTGFPQKSTPSFEKGPGYKPKTGLNAIVKDPDLHPKLGVKNTRKNNEKLARNGMTPITSRRAGSRKVLKSLLDPNVKVLGGTAPKEKDAPLPNYAKTVKLCSTFMKYREG